MSTKHRILIIGAHPDDCEFTAAGTAALWAANGDRQPHRGGRLAQRRHQEALAAAAVIGIEYVILDNHDGELMPTLAVRHQIIDLIRNFRPDLILSPRPNDYHPDHRYTAQVVPNLMYNPIIAYVSDHFQKPAPFAPDVVIDIDSTVEHKTDMLDRHISQVYEWLPWNGGYLDEVPATPAERRTWLRQRLDGRFRRDAELYRHQLIQRYGHERGNSVRYAEAFEGCEYGAPLDQEAITRLFPF